MFYCIVQIEVDDNGIIVDVQLEHESPTNAKSHLQQRLVCTACVCMMYECVCMYVCMYVCMCVCVQMS